MVVDEIKVLDHGFVRFVESWGSDERIIESARMSTSKGFQGWGGQCENCSGLGYTWVGDEPAVEQAPCNFCKGGGKIVGDEKLLKYLYDHKHMTPFEMAGMTIEVQAPIFVFREWHRHRTQSYNEMSGRYTVLPDLQYMPSPERLMSSKQSTSNKQGSAEGFDNQEAVNIYWMLAHAYNAARDEYKRMLDYGVSKEVARLCLPVSQYSKMRASANLRNWLGFLTLRLDSAAQFEIREYAKAVGTIIADRFPRTWELFNA